MFEKTKSNDDQKTPKRKDLMLEYLDILERATVFLSDTSGRMIKEIRNYVVGAKHPDDDKKS